MFGFIWWIIVGLIAGLLGRLLVPGPQPMGWLMTIVLGLVGSVVGGFISSLIFGTDPTRPGIQTSGIIMSTIGAVIVLVAYAALQKRRASGP